jgi:predicted AAA+ superfamily ATPase
MISRAFKPLKILDKNKSLLLLGPRGTGKTYLISNVMKGVGNKVNIDLLSGEQYRRYLHNPSQLAEELAEHVKRKGKTIVSIDEVQKVPPLLDEVHRLIENYKRELVFLLTGSSARKLKRGGANLLAGRAVTKELYPLSQLEIDLDLPFSIQFGTLPEVYLGARELAISVLDSYVSTYLKEEIQQEALVRGIDRFSRFLEIAAQLNSEPVNFAKLGKQIGIAGKTAAEYFNILEDTLIARQLPGWSHSVKKQLLQAPKYYFFDCGVLNSLNGYLRADIRKSSFLYGRLFETFVINQIFASNEYLDLGLHFYYWRNKNGQEVDLIIARNLVEPLLAVEIKSSNRPDPVDCPGFSSFFEDYPQVPRICVCETPRAYREEEIRFLPWQEFVVELDRHIAY